MSAEGTSFWTSFMPHGHSYQWQSDILWLNVLCDGLIAAAFFSIPVALFMILKSRPRRSFRYLIIMFCIFIFSCGLTHVIGIWVVWNGDYGILGISKGITALTSIVTAIMLIPMLPKLSSLKNPKELEVLNLRLNERINTQEILTDKLKRTEQQFKFFINQSPDGVLLNSRSGEIDYSNERVQDMLGYTSDELKELYVTDLLPEGTRDRLSPEHNDLFDETKAISSTMGVEFNALRKNGDEFPVEINIKPIETPEGEEIFITTVRDITNRKAKEVIEHRELLELAHFSRLSTVGQMAAGLAHELNQPLTAISANLHTAKSIYKKQTNPDPVIMGIMEENYASAQRAGQIIKSLRQFISKDASAQQETDVNELVRTTLALMSPEARTANVVLSLELDKNLPTVMADPIQIQQVIVNLGRNSIEALSDHENNNGKVVVSTKCYNADNIIIKVADNGVGLSVEQKASLFKPYKTTKEKGMGLGLSICVSIIEGSGGRLWYEDDERAGAVFCFTLPLIDRDAE